MSNNEIDVFRTLSAGYLSYVRTVSAGYFSSLADKLSRFGFGDLPASIVPTKGIT